jgi:hypothetical protein
MDRIFLEQLKTAGVAVTQQSFVAKTPIGDIPMVNLIATIPGARSDRIAITGHYDTKLFREFRFDGEEATLRDWGGTDHTYGSQYYVDNGRKTGTLSSLKAMVLVDMIGERSPRFMREANSTPWLTDIIWSTAQKLGHGSVFVNASTPIEDDHVPFLKAGVPSTDIIDLDYPQWHTAGDTLDQTSARSLQVVGDVVLAALPLIEARVAR